MTQDELQHAQQALQAVERALQQNPNIQQLRILPQTLNIPGFFLEFRGFKLAIGLLPPDGTTPPPPPQPPAPEFTDDEAKEVLGDLHDAAVPTT